MEPTVEEVRKTEDRMERRCLSSNTKSIASSIDAKVFFSFFEVSKHLICQFFDT